MKKNLETIFLLFFLLPIGMEQPLFAQDYNRSLSELRDDFDAPASDYGVNCWWWWLNGNVDKAAITKDLEAMKSRNFHGAMIFDAGGHNQRGNADIPEGPLYGSAEWIDLFVFALEEADRLDLEIGFNIQSGWNLGGPTVSPEYAAKQLTYSELKVNHHNSGDLILAMPQVRKGLYEEVAVLAFPISEEHKTPEPIFDLDLKLAVHELGGSAPDCRFLLENNSRAQKQALSGAYLVNTTEVIDLSDKMDADGLLDWKVPEGNWVVLRFGYTCTDAEVSTSSGEWQGNVLDYMNREAFETYWGEVVNPILEASSEHLGKTLKYMETDSWECGGMNWTSDFGKEFQHYRGYELKEYLPVVAGYVVEDMNSSLSFLADFRKTIADLVAYEHYAVFQEYAHKLGMGIQPESAGPHAGPMDGIKNYGYNDIVMCEFWSPSPHRPTPDKRFFVKQASSAAHIYGKRIVGAESFTTIGPHWNDELWHDQKPAFDQSICSGLNRVYFHTFTSSPASMGLPGQEYFAGTHVNPQVTWWDQSGAFVDYMHRVQAVVQNGDFVADVLYYYGDHVPNIFPYKYADPAGARFGFDYDVTDETILMQLRVEDGAILVPSGLRYQVLVLPDHRILSLQAIRKVKELLEDGASILGAKPLKMVSLTDGPEGQEEFHYLANLIWGETDAESGEHVHGKGSIAWGMSAKEYLLAQGLKADFGISGNDENNFDYIHYQIGGKDLYFVSNQTEQAQRATAHFRVSQRQPEIWDPLSGKVMQLEGIDTEEGLTSLPLSFDPYGAYFVVFDKEGSAKSDGKSAFYTYSLAQTLEGPWNVDFPKEKHGVGEMSVDALFDWSSHPNPQIKYFSGPAIYTTSFDTKLKAKKSKRIFLELNEVKDVGIAEVTINGVDKGVVWTKPFRVDITDELIEGTNQLEIKVVNSWYNRVAGEQMNAVDDPYTSTNIRLIHDFRGKAQKTIPLESSGLIGPVRIMEGE
ncbi:glycosyl hydrolase [Echinicola pacifica]|nr:glycosyl hydrolase [Echinicola pacifica]